MPVPTLCLSGVGFHLCENSIPLFLRACACNNSAFNLYLCLRGRSGSSLPLSDAVNRALGCFFWICTVPPCTVVSVIVLVCLYFEFPNPAVSHWTFARFFS
eukprot:RCo039482